jgi:hypothetical protein
MESPSLVPSIPRVAKIGSLVSRATFKAASFCPATARRRASDAAATKRLVRSRCAWIASEKAGTCCARSDRVLSACATMTSNCAPAWRTCSGSVSAIVRYIR